MCEAAEGADFADRDHGGDQFEALEGHQGLDERLALPAFQELEHCVLEFGDAFFVEVDGGDVVLEHTIVGGVGEPEFAQVVAVALGPVGFSVVSESEAAKQGEQADLGTAQVIDRVGAGAAQVPDRFINRVGDMDRNEVVGTM